MGTVGRFFKCICYIQYKAQSSKNLIWKNRIDAKYLDVSNRSNAFRLESYRSKGNVSKSHSTQLRCYFIKKCDFITAEPTKAQETDIRLVSDKIFLEKATENTIEIYGKIMKNVLVRSGPVIEKFDFPNNEKRLVIGYK